MNRWTLVLPRVATAAVVICLMALSALVGASFREPVAVADEKSRPATVEPIREKKLEWSNFMLQVQTFQTQARAAYAEAQLAENRAGQARVEADKIFAAMQATAGPDYEPDTEHLQKTGDLRFRLKPKTETQNNSKP